MKKEYINPELTVVKLETAKMIALSFEMDTTEEKEIKNSDDFGAREYDFDEDEY